jgi:tetratricopeptide (TPR) repeat protein
MGTPLERAMADHRLGRLEAAESGYRSVLAAEPEHADALHLLGVTLCQGGRGLEAIDWIDRAIARRPDVAGYHGSRGEALRQLGRLDEAVTAMGRALELDPSLILSHNNLGVARLQLGQAERALASFDEAIRLDPGLTRAWINRGEALQALDRWDEAAIAYRKVLDAEPDNAHVHAYRGHVLVQLGDVDRLDEAERHCRRAIALMPGLSEAHTNLGNVLAAMGRHEDAVASYRAALGLVPDLALPWNNIGCAEHRLGRFDAAQAAFERALAYEPNHPRFHTNLARLLAEQDRDDEAIEHYRIARRCDPAFAEASTGLALVLLKLGRHDEARSVLEDARRLKPRVAEIHLGLGRLLAEVGDFVGSNAAARTALAVRPRSPAAYHQLAANLRGELPDDDLRAMVELVDSPYLDDTARGGLNFGIGTVLHARKRHEEAARYFAMGNACQSAERSRRGQAYDADRQARLCTSIVETFTPAFFRAVRGRGSPSRRPIFVVGMPRSGTTLVEQVLASHPRVSGAGELGCVAEIAGELASPCADGPPGPSAQVIADLDGRSLRAIADRYLARLDEFDRTSDHVVDKMPSNYLYLGLIAALWPEARIIVCRRDPRDIALSCWMNFFSQLRWTNDVRQIAEQILIHDRLLAHWKAVLPVPIVEVVYESLVADFPAQARRMIESIGLDWNPACLDFHSLDRPVRTASLHQVRRPIYSGSVGRWKEYRTVLGPLFETFARHGRRCSIPPDESEPGARVCRDRQQPTAER